MSNKPETASCNGYAGKKNRNMHSNGNIYTSKSKSSRDDKLLNRGNHKECKQREYNDCENDQEEFGKICIKNAVEVLNFNDCRIRKLEKLSEFRNLQKLSFRNNFIKKIVNLDLLILLTDLELYGNQITVIEHLYTLVNLETLDLSFNKISEIKGLSKLKKLKKLFLCGNKISKIENLGKLKTLKLLELSNNKIRKIENIEMLTNLTNLYFDDNKIMKIENLNTLKYLKILSIQTNRLTKIENLSELTNLEELYLSENGINQIEGLENNLKLTTMDLVYNKIQIPVSNITNLSHLKLMQNLLVTPIKIMTAEDTYMESVSTPSDNTAYYKIELKLLKHYEEYTYLKIKKVNDSWIVVNDDESSADSTESRTVNPENLYQTTLPGIEKVMAEDTKSNLHTKVANKLLSSLGYIGTVDDFIRECS